MTDSSSILYYWDFQSSIYSQQICQIPCVNCSPTNFNICLECIAGYFLDASTKQCSQCKYFCKTCSNQSECTSCNANSTTNRLENSLCTCNKGYYDDGKTLNCIQCPYNCGTCSNQKCTSCIENSTTNRENNIHCDCKQGYYDDGQNMNCIRCPYYCKTCSLVNNNIICNSCDESHFRQNNILASCPCQSGYYDDGANGSCQKCPYNCQQCLLKNGKIQCTQCFDDDPINFRQSINNSPECGCISGYYDDGQNKICLQCPYQCLTCQKQLNSDITCLSCPIKIGQDETFRQSISESSKCDCKIGYFDPGKVICRQCDTNCLTCIGNGAQSCLSCDNKIGRTFEKNECLCVGNYVEYNTPQKECLLKYKCHYSCYTCTDSNQFSCLSCSDFRQMSISSTKQQCLCKDGYYEDVNTCKTCNPQCQQCNGPNANNCLKCSDTKRTPQNGICICIEGFIEINGQCQECNQTCKKCKGLTKNDCLDCKTQQHRVLKGNECLCDQGYFQFQSELICSICNKYCLTCDLQTKDKCLSCRQEDFRALSISNGQCDCNDGYFQYQQQVKCEKCSPKCITCTEKEDNCKKCQPPRIFNQGDCSCPDGMYSDSQTFECKVCDQNCKTCSNHNICLTCYEHFSLNEHNYCEQIFPTNLSKETLKDVYNVTESSTYVAIGATATGSVVLAFTSLNTGIAAQFLIMQKLNFLLYINIPYPELIYIFFKALGGTSPFSMLQHIDFFNNKIIKDSAGTPLPNKYTSEKIASNILFNAGGCISLLLVSWIIFVLFLILYKKNTLIQSKLQNMNNYAKFLKLVVENILSFILVTIHFVATLIISFSIAIQLASLSIDFSSTENNVGRLIVTLILIIYIALLIVKTLQIVNNTKNYLIEFKEYYNDNVESFIYRVINDVFRWDNIFVRNYKLFYLIIENILIPLSVAFFYFNFKVQTILFLIFQLILCGMSIWLRPFKSTIQNVFLIIEQICWVIILTMITTIGFKIEDILTRSKISSQEIQLMDGLSWVIVIMCLLILFSNPLSVFIEICINYKLYFNKIKKVYYWVMQKLCGYQTNCNDYSNQNSIRFLNESFSKNYQSHQIHNNSFLRNKSNNIPISLFDISSGNISPKKKSTIERSSRRSPIRKNSQINQLNFQLNQPSDINIIRDSPNFPVKQKNQNHVEFVKINLLKQKQNL